MGCKDIGVKISEFVAKTQFLCTDNENSKKYIFKEKIPSPSSPSSSSSKKNIIYYKKY